MELAGSEWRPRAKKVHADFLAPCVDATWGIQSARLGPTKSQKEALCGRQMGDPSSKLGSTSCSQARRLDDDTPEPQERDKNRTHRANGCKPYCGLVLPVLVPSCTCGFAVCMLTHTHTQTHTTHTHNTHTRTHTHTHTQIHTTHA